jgi:hypothetical protein
MSHFSTEIEYDPNDYKDRRRKHIVNSAVVYASAVAWLIVTLIMLGVSALGSVASLVLLLPLMIVLMNAGEHRHDFLRIVGDRKIIDTARDKLSEYVGFIMPMSPEGVKFSISLSRSGKDSDTYMLNVSHEDPMFKPWQYIVSQTSVRTSDGSPAFLRTLERLSIFMDDPGDKRAQLAHELEREFERVGVPGSSDPTAYAYLGELLSDD